MEGHHIFPFFALTPRITFPIILLDQLPDLFEIKNIPDFPEEYCAIISQDNPAEEVGMLLSLVPLRHSDIQSLFDEAIRTQRTVPYGFKHPRVAGFAIANPLRRERTGEIYAVGVYLKYKVLVG